MKNLILLALIFGSITASAEEKELKLFNLEKTELNETPFMEGSKACAKAAFSYVRSIKMLQGRSNTKTDAFPYYLSSRQGEKTVITGAVNHSENSKEIVLTETGLDMGISNKLSIPFPSEPTIITISGISEGGLPLKVFASPKCGAFVNPSIDTMNSCPDFLRAKQVKVKQKAKQEYSNADIFFSLEHLATFHKRNNLDEKFENEKINMPDRYLKSCLNSYESNHINKVSIFKTIFPNSSLSGGESTGGFGGGKTARIVSK